MKLPLAFSKIRKLFCNEGIYGITPSGGFLSHGLFISRKLTHGQYLVYCFKKKTERTRLLPKGLLCKHDLYSEVHSNLLVKWL